MDSDRFDSLTRQMAGSQSRRTLLRTLAGGLTAAVVGLARPGSAEAAKCGKEGQPCGCCQRGLSCTGGACCPTDRVCGSACCPAGHTCQNGSCVRAGSGVGSPGGCPAGQAACAGGCADITSDIANCGACGRACPRSTDPCGIAICTNGVCGFAPAAPGAVCRPAAGPCDVAEYCDGASPSCPPDAFLPATVACRPVAGECDVAEYCSGTAAACPPDAFLPATVACRAASCTDGIATYAATCTGGGATCSTLVSEACTPRVCGATACLTTCAADTDCVANYHCDSGACLANEGLGRACDEASDCASGFCVDGVCCNTACTGQCEACNLAATLGTCSPANGVPCDDGDAATCDDICQNGVCSGTTCVTCPGVAGGPSVTCASGETCAVTPFEISDITGGGSPETTCCPADGVLCEFGSTFPSSISVCCPAGATCETQKLGDAVFPRCSTQGVICPSGSGPLGFETCAPGETCAFTALTFSDGGITPRMGCCPAGGLLCDIGPSTPYDLCCPATDTCQTQTVGTYPRCSSHPVICPANSIGGFVTCPAGDTCEKQSFGGSNWINRCSSQGEFCPNATGGSTTCPAGETCTLTAYTVTDAGSTITFGCCAAGSTLCPAPAPGGGTINRCCPADATCGTATDGTTTYPVCVAA